jgi:hypothetical protein
LIRLIFAPVEKEQCSDSTSYERQFSDAHLTKGIWKVKAGALLAVLALLIARPVLAATPKPGAWIAYAPATQTCQSSPLTPHGLVESIRHQYHVDAETADIVDPGTGKITETDVYSPIGFGLYLHFRLFHKMVDCEAYANRQKAMITRPNIRLDDAPAAIVIQYETILV